MSEYFIRLYCRSHIKEHQISRWWLVRNGSAAPAADDDEEDDDDEKEEEDGDVSILA